MCGTRPQAPVASELAAMFSAVVVPTLREHYIDRAQPNWQADFVQQCKHVCSQLGLPQHQWARITLPAFVSIDHDPRHGHLRQLLSLPRVPAAELRTTQRHTYEDVLGVTTPQELDSRQLGRAVDLTQLVPGSPLATQLQRQQQLDLALANYQAQHGCELWHYTKFQLALYRPEFITLIPQQFMPLCKVAPDIHCPVEHMVRTIKNEVQEQILATDLNDQRLWTGGYYQELIMKAVAKHGSGDQGRHHIAGSVRKQPVVCQILAAEQGEELKVRYVFGEDTGCKKRVHRVVGTAGGWITDTRWT